MKPLGLLTIKIFFLLSLSWFFISACSEQQETVQVEAPAVMSADLVTAMFENMGGLDALRQVESIVMQGDGTRNRLGQIPETGGIDPDAKLIGLTETIDYVNGHAAFDNDIVIGEDFSQHRTEVLTSYRGEKIGWGSTVGRPNIATSVNGLFSWATQNTPEMLLRRNIISIALAADSVPAGQVAEEREFNNSLHWYAETTLNGESIGLFFDQDSGFLGGFAATDTETMLGDVEAEYVFSDYRNVDDLMLPFELLIYKDGDPYSSVQYSSIVINDSSALGIFDIPEDVINQADEVIAADGSWVQLQWNPVTDNVTHIVAFSHHSLVVEFPEFVAVVEGAYTEAQSLTLANMIAENIGKPIRYVIPTHPHYDHTGGIRGFASIGADILVAAGHEAELRMIVESPHSNPPDALSRRINEGVEVGQIEVFVGMTEIVNGSQSLQLYELFSIPHVSPKVLAFVPGTGVLFQSDLFFGGPGPDAAALYQAIQDLGLEVSQIAGGHGGVFPFSVLEEAVGEN